MAGGQVWPLVVGLVLILAGIGLRAWSIATLGRFFQYQIRVQSGHHVVTGGPYRYVRHPSYTGIALILIGIALACDDVWSLLAVAVLGGVGLGCASTPRNGSWNRRWAANTGSLRPAASAWCPGCGEPAGSRRRRNRNAARWVGAPGHTGPVRITVRVRPGSAHPGVGGAYGDALVVRVSPRAVDGKATAAALAAIAGAFGVPRQAVTLVSGAASRTKVIDVAGGDPAVLDRLLAG